jgi:Tol biopolymer transport system component
MSASARTVTVATALTLIGVAMLPGGREATAQSRSASGVSAPQQLASAAVTDAAHPALSYSGRYIAYFALRSDQASPRQELRRTDLANGSYELLNRSIDGRVGGGSNSVPVISADGSRVAFVSTATRLVPDDTNGRRDAFVRDASTDTTLLASAAFDGGVADGDSGETQLSKNGRYAVFSSRATDVVPGSTMTNWDVYRRDLDGRTTVQVSVQPNGAPSRGAGSNSVDVSADGNLVAFASYATDLAVTDGADQEPDLFIRNMTTRQTRWLSSGLPVGAAPSGVILSPDGQWVSSRWADASLHLTRVDTGVTSTVVPAAYATSGAFSSKLGRFAFVSGRKPYLRDLATGVNTAISTPAGGAVNTVTLSGNGRFAAYDWFPDDGGPALIFRVAL